MNAKVVIINLKFSNIVNAPIKYCPRCNKKVRRLIGKGAGIIFSRHNNFYTFGRDPVQKLISETKKGSGFYATDYRRASKKDENNKEGKVSKSCFSCSPSPSSCSTCKK